MLSHEFITESKQDQIDIENIADIVAKYINGGGQSSSIGDITGHDGILKDVLVKTTKNMPKTQGMEVSADAAYDPDNKSIIVPFNAKNLQSELVHELQHALDDIKSNGKFLVGKKSSTPKSGATPTSKYLSLPYEINARFSQAIHSLAKRLSGVTLSKEDLILAIKTEFAARDISTYFPERSKDPEYRRLLTRALTYLEDRI